MGSRGIGLLAQGFFAPIVFGALSTPSGLTFNPETLRF